MDSHISIKTDMKVLEISIKISLELLVGNLVARFKFSIIFVPLLNGIICKVNKFIGEVVDGVFS